MIMHLGSGYFVDTRNVIGIFDLENTTIGQDTRNFLKSQTNNGDIIDVSFDMPKSFVVAIEGTYMCQMAVSTLRKRIKNKEVI